MVHPEGGSDAVMMTSCSSSATRCRFLPHVTLVFHFQSLLLFKMFIFMLHPVFSASTRSNDSDLLEHACVLCLSGGL